MKALQTAVAIALLMPALAMAQKVSFDFDKTEDFSRIKSYTLKEGTKGSVGRGRSMRFSWTWTERS